MKDKSTAIREILRDFGVYDFIMSKFDNEVEAFHLFQEDFQSLINLCSNIRRQYGTKIKNETTN